MSETVVIETTQILPEEKIREELECKETNVSLSHLMTAKYIDDHMVLAVFQHEENPFTGETLSYVPFYPCRYSKDTPYFDMVKNSTKAKIELGEFMGYRLHDIDLPAWDNIHLTFVRQSVILNNPASKQHLNYTYRMYLKSILPKDAGNLINKARKLSKYKFVEEYPEYEYLWSLAKKSFDTIGDAIRTKKELDEKYKVSEEPETKEKSLEEWF